MNKRSTVLYWGPCVLLAIALIFKRIGRGYMYLASDYLFLAVSLIAGVGLTQSAVQLAKGGGAPGRVFIKILFALVVLIGAPTFFLAGNIGADTWLTRAPKDFDTAGARSTARAFETLDDPGPQLLSAISEAVQRRRVVGLGEGHHLTSEYSQAKVALVRYLHEHEGFDLLAFESPIATLELALQNMKESNDPEAGLSGLFAVWHTEEVLPLFKYVLSTWSTERPLRLVGIDPQHFFQDWNSAGKFLQETLAEVDGPLAAEEAAERNRWESIMRKRKHCRSDDPMVAAGRDLYLRMADVLRNEAEARRESTPDRALRLELAAMVADGIAVDWEILTLSNPESFYLRDRTMAANIIRLADQLLPDSRIMVWAHNTHLTRRPDLQQGLALDVYRSSIWWRGGRRPWEITMGRLLGEHFAADYYSLGWLTRGGRCGSMYRFGDWDPVRALRRDSVESLLGPEEAPAVFLDLDKHRSYYAGRSLCFREGHSTWWRAEIQQQFDGLLILDKVSPPDRSPLRHSV
ncbi:hypothetical protein CSB20_11680 [bacterium DOLZORAL124_64_63]|nr:MAG: hypothetical protein CSB20_11680 [bacterium DOLZORAL124_64_63]